METFLLVTELITLPVANQDSMPSMGLVLLVQITHYNVMEDSLPNVTMDSS
jgi:hypothetical protein